MIKELPKTKEDAKKKDVPFFFDNLSCANGHIDKKRTATGKCNTCQREERALWEQRNKDYFKNYEKTPKGKLMRTYRNMKSRVSGVQKRGRERYLGKDILPKEDFYSWSLNDENFKSLFKEWEKSEFDKKLSPSIDRIDTTKGYTKDNIRWITMSENSKLGGLHKKRC